MARGSPGRSGHRGRFDHLMQQASVDIDAGNRPPDRHFAPFDEHRALAEIARSSTVFPTQRRFDLRSKER